MDDAGRFFHAEGAPARLPEEIIGENGLGGQPDRHRDSERARGAAGIEKIEHSYPHCWRCHQPTIFRATEQWFIGMDRNDLRTERLEAIKQVKWMPAWGEERIVEHDRDAARLVHLAPARLGRADHRVLLR